MSMKKSLKKRQIQGYSLQRKTRDKIKERQH